MHFRAVDERCHAAGQEEPVARALVRLRVLAGEEGLRDRTRDAIAARQDVSVAGGHVCEPGAVGRIGEIDAGGRADVDRSEFESGAGAVFDADGAARMRPSVGRTVGEAGGRIARRHGVDEQARARCRGSLRADIT